MREAEERYGRARDVLANLHELPLLKRDPSLYAERVRECEHLDREVQIVMTGSIIR
jgi:hypothetical protein